MTLLPNAHILVVGGSRGIGASCARTCADAGADVGIVYRANDDAARSRESRRSKGWGGASSPSAPTPPTSGRLEDAIVADVAALGPLHGLVVCAGVFEGLPSGGDDRRVLGPHDDPEPPFDVPGGEARRPAHGPRSEHRDPDQHGGPARLGGLQRLCGEQGRPDHVHAVDGEGARPENPRQLRRPCLDRNRHGRRLPHHLGPRGGLEGLSLSGASASPPTSPTRFSSSSPTSPASSPGRR